MGKILVTGADGFIGSHLVETLVRRGQTVKAFVFYNSFNSWGWLDRVSQEIKEQVEVFAGDIRDPHGVMRAMNDCSGVFHLAALIAIPFSYHSPDSYVDTNVKGTLNVLQAARHQGVEKVVHTSTSEVYGTARYVPIDENHPLQGQSPYSATKIGADELALSFYRSFELPVAVIRPFNTYGPRQSARAIIPTIITQIASGRSEIRLGSLHPTRDMNYIKDTVEGFIQVGRSNSSIGEVINIGSNYEVAMGDLVTMIANIMKKEIDIISDDQRVRPPKSEVERLWANNSKAIRLLKWRPQYAGIQGLEKGLAETIAWFSNPKNLVLYKSEIYSL